MILDSLHDFGTIDCGNANLWNFGEPLDLRVERDLAANRGLEIALKFTVSETFVGASARLQMGFAFTSDPDDPTNDVNTYLPILTGGAAATPWLVAGLALTVGDPDLKPYYVPLPRPHYYLAAGAQGADGRTRYLAPVCYNAAAPGNPWTAGMMDAQLVYTPPNWRAVEANTGF